MAPSIFFNSLNLHFDGNYSKLSSLWKLHGNWEAAFKNERALPDPEKEWSRLSSSGIKLVLSDSPQFPELLRQIPYPPFGLYVKGVLDPETPKVAVVGTRKASEDGLALAFEFGNFLAGKGLCVTSGLAFGVDKSAHEGALSVSGNTVAVLPSGLNAVYPAAHSLIAQKILEKGGALVSEYPMGHKPAPYNFLERNRIISGLARGVVIIEAPEASGAMATARFALEQNREVFVVPGPAKHRNYAGSHGLIKSGAALVTAPSEVLEILGIEPGNNDSLATFEERAILKVLRSSGRPLSMEEIVASSSLPAPVVSQAVSFLVLKSQINDYGSSYGI